MQPLDDRSAVHHASGAVVQACTIEIVAQAALLAVVVVPTVAFYSCILIAFGAYFVANLAGDFSSGFKGLGGWAQTHWPLLVSMASASIALLGVRELKRHFNSTTRTLDAGRRTRPLVGQAGDALAKIVGELWAGLPQRSGSLPSISWFTNFNVMATAADGAGFREIQVSSALWERAIRRDPVAIGILAHEMAHLLFRDGRLLRLVEAVVTATSKIIKVVVCVVISVATLLMCSLLLTAFKESSWSNLLFQLAAVLAFLALILLIPVLGMLAVRRQAALIIALTETRADAFGGLFTNGLSGFARALAADTDVKPTSLTDISHSVFSPDMTHVSTVERIALLADVARLTTPKVRYLALSLTLPFVIPLNPITPLLLGGALDHLFVALVVVAAHVTTIAMVIASADAQPQPMAWSRVAILGAFLCIASVLPHVNLYEIGYLLTHLAVGLVVPGGFGLDPITWTGVHADLQTATGGLAKRLAEAVGGPFVVLGFAVSIVSIRILSTLSRAGSIMTLDRPTKWFWMLPAIAGGVIAFLSTYDEWRTIVVLPFNLSTYWMSLTDPVPWVRCCAPELLASIVLFGQMYSIRAKS